MVPPPKSLAPICTAVDSRALSKVQELLANGSNPNSVCPFGGVGNDLPILCEAADIGDAGIVEALIKANADVNSADGTPLLRAAFHGYATVAQMLLRAGANVNATNDGMSALYVAALSCQADTASLLLSAGASVDIRTGLDGRQGDAPLHAAAYKAERQCVQVVKALIQSGADVNAIGDLGNTPLMSALKGAIHHHSWTEERAHVVADLLDAGANPLIANEEGENAVVRASKCGNDQIYRMIVKRARLFLANPGQE